MKPLATITFENGAQVIIELLPEFAPNTVNSFIFLASQGVFDNRAIARVEPGFVIDVSTNAFGCETCRYLIENEATQARGVQPDLGFIAMGGYNGNIAGGEFFFPLARHKKLEGKYPCFGRIVTGLAEIVRIGSLPVREFRYNPNEGYVMHKPLSDEIISSVRIETYGLNYPEPQRLQNIELPKHWFMEEYDKII